MAGPVLRSGYACLAIIDSFLIPIFVVTGDLVIESRLFGSSTPSFPPPPHLSHLLLMRLRGGAKGTSEGPHKDPQKDSQKH